MKTLLFIALLYLNSIFSQVLISGKINNGKPVLADIEVINISNEKTTKTDDFGNFYIEASEDDLLIFQSLAYTYWRYSISKNDIINKNIAIILEPKINELDEVILKQFPNINAQNLGIINYSPKKITPVESKLNHSADLSPQVGLFTGEGGIAFNFDAIINKLNGNKKMWKKELQIEKKEKTLTFLNENYDDRYFINQLKIKENHISSFKYFVIEDLRFLEALQKGNLFISFCLSQLATEFNSYQNDK